MKISRNWLADYLDVSDLTAGDFKEVVTTKIAEVDSVVEVAQPLANASVVAVKSVKPHPKRENLKVATIQTGSAEADVVCGAPNCSAGMLAVYVPPGGRVVAESADEGQVTTEITARDVAGVTSQGVLVSERELGITSDHSGLLTLSEFPTAEVGTRFAELVGGPDLIITIDNKAITHRPDLWCHFGFVRELAAILHRSPKRSFDDFADDREPGTKVYSFPQALGQCSFNVVIEEASQCRRFLGVEIQGIKNTTSPLWIRRRLSAVGAGVRNVLVDLSNFVQWDVGQPNHAYDATKIAGKTLTIRNAKPGEKFFGLDQIERTLDECDVVVADAVHAACLGGILGGEHTAIQESTTHLFLEAANWEPGRIRMTGKRHNVRTDASARFEKSQSQFSTRVGIERFVELLRELQPNVKLSTVADIFPRRPAPVSITARPAYVNSRLGVAVDSTAAKEILQYLGFGVTADASAADTSCTEERWNISVPYFRATRDVSMEDDIVEEVGRIFGYDRIPATAPSVAVGTAVKDPIRDYEYKIRDSLSAMGFAEAYAYSFASETRSAELGFSTENAVRLANPIDAEKTIMRVSLVPSMLELLERNARFSPTSLLFELGRTYYSDGTGKPHKGKGGPPARERRLLSLGVAAQKGESRESAAGEDFYALLHIVRRVNAICGAAEVRVQPARSNDSVRAGDDYSFIAAWMHPYRQATLLIGDTAVGVIAEVRPGVVDVGNARPVVAELDLAAVLRENTAPRTFVPLPKFPVSYFEMSIVSPERTPFSELERVVRKGIDPTFLKEVELLTVYAGAPLAPGEKSTSVRLSLGADDRTLSSEELTNLQNGLMSAVESTYALRR